MDGKKKPIILLISSANPYEGPGILGADILSAFRKQGYDCDLLTKYEVSNHPEILYVFRTPRTLVSKFIGKIVKKIALNTRFRFLKKIKPGYFFFYKKEEQPPVPINKILTKIKRNYDYVGIIFWQELISFQTVEAIYDKLHCVISFFGVDYSQMSGGCHFTNDCKKYVSGCGCCDAFNSKDPNDFTHHNILFRKRVYDKVKPLVCGNLYMKTFYDRSYLLKNYPRIVLGHPLIDENIFKPLDFVALKSKYAINLDIEFIIFFGCQNIADERKGFAYLLKALQILYEMVEEKYRKSIFLLIAGKNVEEIKDKLPFEYKYTGYVPIVQLPELYSLSNVYVCPSVNDAGPMMVNQSIMCGTPVVGFEMGALLSAVKNCGTGYCAEMKNSKDLAICLYNMYKLKKEHPEQYAEMRRTCRSFGMKTSSRDAWVRTKIDEFQLYDR